MPTGYTSIIDDNVKAGRETSFEEFAWRCARAFGALVMMREDSLDTPVPEELQPAPYYLERVAQCEEAFAKAKAMTLAEAEADLAATVLRVNADNERRLAEHTELARAYQAMRVRAAKWSPPSSEHAGLRSFMLEQLDTGGPSDRVYLESVPSGTAESWLWKLVEDAAKELGRARDYLREEEDRTRSRNEWLRTLRASVPMPTKNAELLRGVVPAAKEDA